MVIRLLTIIIGCRNPTNLPRAVWDSDPEAAIVSYLSTLDLCLRFYHLLFVSLLYHLILFNFVFASSIINVIEMFKKGSKGPKMDQNGLKVD